MSFVYGGVCSNSTWEIFSSHSSQCPASVSLAPPTRSHLWGSGNFSACWLVPSAEAVDGIHTNPADDVQLALPADVTRVRPRLRRLGDPALQHQDQHAPPSEPQNGFSLIIMLLNPWDKDPDECVLTSPVFSSVIRLPLKYKLQLLYGYWHLNHA